jgi:hypothetical protein
VGTFQPALTAATLKVVADDGDTLIRLSRERGEAGWTTPEIEAGLAELLGKYGHDHARFVEAANEAVRPSAPPQQVPSN